MLSSCRSSYIAQHDLCAVFHHKFIAPMASAIIELHTTHENYDVKLECFPPPWTIEYHSKYISVFGICYVNWLSFSMPTLTL